MATRTRTRPSRGLVLGGYELVAKVDAGGNGEIWRAVGPAGERAYKIVSTKSVDAEKYRRFRREIETLVRLRDSGLGILPIFDSYLPSDPATELAWFSMPLARTLDVALAGKPLLVKLRAVRDVALTLADLAAEHGIHHRDVKPANLYSHGGRSVIGDFGLVKRLDPADEQLTRTEHVPGPRNYMPPDAFLRPTEAAEGLIDVYCLAKTLWVIVTEEKGPPGGQIRAGDRWSLSRLLPEEPLAAIDELIERATSNDPDERPTMSEVAEALSRYLHSRHETGGNPAEGPAPPQAVEAPTDVARRTVELLDIGSDVARREFIKAERRRFERTLQSLLEERQHSSGGEDLETFEAAIIPELERYLAVHLPLVEHRSPLLPEQIDELARIGNTPYVGEHSNWSEFPSWTVWWLGHAIGAYAVSIGRFEAVGLLFRVTIDQNLGTKALPSMLTPEPWRALMEAALPITRGNAPQGAQFQHLASTLNRSGLIKDMYPEFPTHPTFGASRYIFDFNFLGSLLAAEREEKVIGYWTTRHDAACDLARRLQRDDNFRAQVAHHAFGVDGAEFDRRLPGWVQKLVERERPLLLLPNGYSESDALAVLLGDPSR